MALDLIDFSRFVWRTDPNISGRHIREAGGGEYIQDIWNITKGENNLFLGVYVTLQHPIFSAALLQYIEKAWISLRWDVPTIAASTAHIFHPEPERPPTTFIVYDTAQKASDLSLWVSETVAAFPEYKDKTLDDLRYDIAQEPIPAADYGRQTFLYLVPYSATRFGLLLRTSHIPFDGTGIKVVMTKFLRHLEGYLSDPVRYQRTQGEACKWGSEGEQLLPFVTEILRKHEPPTTDENGVTTSPELQAEIREGKEYFECLAGVMSGLVEGQKKAHPFKSLIEPAFDRSKLAPRTKRLEHKFTIEESSKICAAGKLGGMHLTVNNIVHGALCLLPLYDNPPSSEDRVNFFIFPINARKRLDAKYRGRLDYPGFCLGVSGISVPNSLYQSCAEEPRRVQVLEYAKAIKQEYKKQAEMTSLLAIEPQQGDLMAQGPPPALPWASPWYSADGKGSNYLDGTYPDTSTGRELVLQVDDFFIGLNRTDPGSFFRCTEWKGRVMLSVDFNERAVEEDVMRKWMNLWAELILAAVE